MKVVRLCGLINKGLIMHHKLPKKYKCPRCDERLVIMVLADSDDRIYARWLQCSCGFDTRNPDDLAEYQSSAKSNAA